MSDKSSWEVELYAEFEIEFDDFDRDVQDELIARAGVLAEFGPLLGRPNVDTLNASKHANMKELRFSVHNGVWRVAFAFDPKRTAILLVAGNKKGQSKTKFYKDLISVADRRFDLYIQSLEDK